MGAECRGIDHLGMLVPIEKIARADGQPDEGFSRVERVTRFMALCVACDARIEVDADALDPRRSLKLPISFEVGSKAHVHERQEIMSPYGDMNVCRTCTRHLTSHAFTGGPDSEGVVWRPPRCSRGAHDYHVLGGTAPSDAATCSNCGDEVTVEEALG